MLKTFKINIFFKRVNTINLNKVVIIINIPKINKGIIYFSYIIIISLF